MRSIWPSSKWGSLLIMSTISLFEQLLLLVIFTDYAHAYGSGFDSKFVWHDMVANWWVSRENMQHHVASNGPIHGLFWSSIPSHQFSHQINCLPFLIHSAPSRWMIYIGEISPYLYAMIPVIVQNSNVPYCMVPEILRFLYVKFASQILTISMIFSCPIHVISGHYSFYKDSSEEL